jgi:hypothetical protein
VRPVPARKASHVTLGCGPQMPSQLVNLHRQLTFGTPPLWNGDFQLVNFPVPDPGQEVETAQTAAHWGTAGLWVDPMDKTGKTWKLKDSIVVTITLYPKPKCWVANWVFTKKDQAYRDDLLKHEQGHYDITALLGRDVYNALIALIPNTYASGQGEAAAAAEINKIKNVGQPMSDLYDAQTKNGTDAAQQAAWNGYISTAFAGSGSFLSVLAQNGITVTPLP